MLPLLNRFVKVQLVAKSEVWWFGWIDVTRGTRMMSPLVHAAPAQTKACSPLRKSFLLCPFQRHLYGKERKMNEDRKIDFKAIKSPIVLDGDSNTAYRDATAIYHDGVFRLYATIVTHESEEIFYWRIGVAESRDLFNWTEPRSLTPKDRTLNFSSPGNVIRFDDEWVLCLQTYVNHKGGMVVGLLAIFRATTSSFFIMT